MLMGRFIEVIVTTSSAFLLDFPALLIGTPSSSKFREELQGSLVYLQQRREIMREAL
jgi:hypothetical protein